MKVKINEIVVHTDWDPEGIVWDRDLAIMVLESAVDVAPIKMPETVHVLGDGIEVS